MSAMHKATCYHIDCDEDDYVVHECNRGVCVEWGEKVEGDVMNTTPKRFADLLGYDDTDFQAWCNRVYGRKENR